MQKFAGADTVSRVNSSSMKCALAAVIGLAGFGLTLPQKIQAGDFEPEDSLHQWGPQPPDDFVRNTEAP